MGIYPVKETVFVCIAYNPEFFFVHSSLTTTTYFQFELVT